jgi:hypothetical protein
MVELVAKTMYDKRSVRNDFSSFENPIKVGLKSKLLVFLKSKVLGLGHKTRLLG